MIFWWGSHCRHWSYAPIHCEFGAIWADGRVNFESNNAHFAVIRHSWIEFTICRCLSYWLRMTCSQLCQISREYPWYFWNLKPLTHIWMKLCTDYQSLLWTFEICLWQIAWDLGKLALAGQPGVLKNSVYCVFMFQNIFFWIFLDKVMIRYNVHAIVGYCQLAIVCEDVLLTFWSISVYLYIYKYIYIYVSLSI